MTLLHLAVSSGIGEGKLSLKTLRVIKFCHDKSKSSLPISSDTRTLILLTETLSFLMYRVAFPKTFMGAPLAASNLAEVRVIVAPHCFMMLLLATPLVHPGSGAAATLTLCRDAQLRIVHGNRGVSLQGDLKTAGLDGPVLPFLDGAIALHLCLTTLARAAGLGEL